MRVILPILLVLVSSISAFAIDPKVADLSVNEDSAFLMQSPYEIVTGRLDATRTSDSQASVNHICEGFVNGTTVDIVMQASNYLPNGSYYTYQNKPAATGWKHAYCVDEWPGGELDESYIGWIRNTIRFRVYLGI